MDPRDAAAQAASAARGAADDAVEVVQDAAAAAAAAESAARAAAAASADAKARGEERALLVELGVDPEDPQLESAVSELQAGASEELPFGRPGVPAEQRSPWWVAFGATVGVLLAAMLAYGVYLIADILLLLVISLFLATGLSAAVDFVEARGLRRRWAVVVVLLTVVVVVAGVLGTIAPQIVAQGTELREDAPAIVADLAESSDTIRRLDERFDLVGRAERLTSTDVLEGGDEELIGLAQRVGTSAFSTLTVLVLTTYCVAAFPRLKRSAYRLAPRSRRGRVSLLGDEILGRIGRYLIGAFTHGSIAGLASATFLAIAGVPRPLALALFVAVTDVIPLIGATIGAVVAVAVAFTVSVPVGIAAIVFFALYQLFENFFIVPRVMRRAVNVAPGATIVAVLIGGTLLGVLGALLAVPTAAAIQLLVTEVVHPRQDAH